MNFTEVRPQPPRKVKRDFKVGDKVDAYHDDGWWVGVVTEHLGNERFTVFFESSKEKIDFFEEELRLHFKWVDGKWISSVEDNVKEENEGKVCQVYAFIHNGSFYYVICSSSCVIFYL